MPRQARAALKRAVTATSKADWEIDGEIRQRTYGADPIRLSRRGAHELLHQLEAHDYETERQWIAGRIDGFRGSLGTFYLIPAGTGRPVGVSVPDPEILKKVRQLAASEDALVEAQIETVRIIGEDEHVSVSRTLLDIQPRAAQQHLPEC